MTFVNCLMKGTFLLLVFILIPSLLSQKSAHGQKTTSLIEFSLKGSVVDLAGNPIKGVTLTLESEKFLYKITTNKNGDYKIIVSDGVYEIFTESLTQSIDFNDKLYMPDKCKAYFRPFKRASIKLVFPKQTILNLVLIPSGAICSLTSGSKKPQMGLFMQYSQVNLHPKIKFETIDLLNNTITPNDVVIQYSKRQYEAGITSYFTAVNAEIKSIFKDDFLFTTVTYDSTTIYAERVFYDKKKKTIRAKNAIYDVNGRRKRFKEIVMKMGGGSSPTFIFKTLQRPD